MRYLVLMKCLDIRMTEKIKIIGLTGGIGSGKTTVAKLLECKGYSVYYSDIRAKEIVNNNTFLKTRIIQLLGDKAYDQDGRYNRKWVAHRVFNDENLLLELNKIIHPAVRDDFEFWVKEQKADFVFKETALLFELNLDKNCFKTILVTADESLRIKRVMERDGKTCQEVKNIIQKQMSEQEKRKRADFIIENNTDLESLRNEVDIILFELNKIDKHEI